MGMSLLLRVTFDIPSKDYDCLTSETYFIPCLIYLIEFSLRPILYVTFWLFSISNTTKDKMSILLPKLLSEGAHSLLGWFTDLTFSRDANNKTMLPGVFFQLGNGIFWAFYKIIWLNFLQNLKLNVVYFLFVSQSGSSWETEKRDR